MANNGTRTTSTVHRRRCQFWLLCLALLPFISLLNFLIVPILEQKKHKIKEVYEAYVTQKDRWIEPASSNTTTAVVIGKSCVYHQRRGVGVGGGWTCQECDTTTPNCKPLVPVNHNKPTCPPFRRAEIPMDGAYVMIPLNQQQQQNEQRQEQQVQQQQQQQSALLQWHSLSRYIAPGRVRERYLQPDCTFLNPQCFQLSRCNSSSNFPLTIYLEDAGLESLVQLSLDENVTKRVSSPYQACFIVRTWKEVFRRSPSPSQNPLPYWDGGRNHLIYGSHGDPPFHAGEHWGYAVVASGQRPFSHFRIGYDISLALPDRWQPPTEAKNNRNITTKRPILLSFKGKIKNNHQAYYQHRWLAAEYWDTTTTTNDTVVVDVRCEYRKLLRRGTTIYRDYQIDDYGSLLFNSTFVFAPGGSGVNSYRFWEALSAGAIPVIPLGFQVPPFYPELDWDRCLLYIHEGRIVDLPNILSQISQSEIAARQRACGSIYRTFLDDTKTSTTASNPTWSPARMFLHTAKILSKRVQNAFTVLRSTQEYNSEIFD